jgi:hypothetical protein
VRQQPWLGLRTISGTRLVSIIAKVVCNDNVWGFTLSSCVVGDNIMTRKTIGAPKVCPPLVYFREVVGIY